VKKKHLKIARKKVWEKIEPFSHMNFHFPKNGWVKTIREILSITSYQLANKLNISQASLIRLEQREKNKSLTLKSLEKAASALNCRVEYILIPEKSFEDKFEERAKKYARNLLAKTISSMELEDQAVNESDSKMHYEMLVRKLVEESNSEIWNDM